MGVDAVIARLAARQHGVVSRRQLTAAGVSSDAVRHRVETGRLARVHRGVYVVGPTHAPLTSPMAAVLACGPNAVLSHRAAAALHGIAKWRGGDFDVTVPRGQPRSRRGIRVHRAEVTSVRVHGIPTTTPTRTLLDLATVLPKRELERAVEEAQVQRKVTRASLTRAVEEAGGHPGVRALRAAAERAGASEPALTRSEAERRLVELVRRAGLPRAETNKRVGHYEVDLVWPEQRVVVEVDGFAFHSTREAFERDRRKTAELAAAGWRVSRVTWRQLVDEREAVVARLARTLSAAP